MHKQIIHNNQPYDISVRDLNAGGMAGPRTWQVTATDQHNAELVNATMNGDLAEYIKVTFGQSHVDFLVSFAESEIKKQRP